MRMRIVELPLVGSGDRVDTPFLIVFDRVPEVERDDLDRELRANMKDETGARAVLAFTSDVDIPAGVVGDPTTAGEPTDPATATSMIERFGAPPAGRRGAAKAKG
jgi:hypothetical protein